MARLIDPRIAGAIAARIARDPVPEPSRDLARLRASLERAVPRAEELVEAASGISAPGPVRWDVISRATWARVNIDGMASLLAPVVDRIGPRLDAAPLPVRLAQRSALSAEVGLLMGYIARRVLGQYDVLVPEDPSGEGVGAAPVRRSRRFRTKPEASLYFVGPNLIETGRRWSFDEDDFVLWVALHEVTHRFQFAGVPWLRDRFFGLVRSYVDSLELDSKGLSRTIGTAVRRLFSSSTPPTERNPIYLFASDPQRRLLDEIQAVMAVVEGHGNFVMDTVGAEVIPSMRRMRDTLERRRANTSRMQRALHQAIGLDMKLRQYELGQRFCEAVVARSGAAGLARLWEDPTNLPTLEELRDPARWLTRVA